jgi:Tol biopolymer transport system component
LTTSPEQDWNPRWSPDGKSIVFDQQLTGDSTLWVAHRRPDGSWEKPQALPHKGYAALAVWSPDGRSIAFSGLAVKVLDLNTGTERSLTDAPSTGTWISWSPDSRWIYYTREEPTRGFIIRVVPTAGGSPRTVVYANLPDRQVHRYGFSLANGRFYFPLVEQKADVWVAEVEPK